MAVKPQYTEQMVVLVTPDMRDYVEAVSARDEVARSKAHRTLLEAGIAAHMTGDAAPTYAELAKAKADREAAEAAKAGEPDVAVRVAVGAARKAVAARNRGAAPARRLRTTEAKPVAEPLPSPVVPVQTKVDDLVDAPPVVRAAEQEPAKRATSLRAAMGGRR